VPEPKAAKIQMSADSSTNEVRAMAKRRAANFLDPLKVKFAELPEGELRKRVFYALGV